MAATVALRAVAHYLPERTLKVPDLPELDELPAAEAETCLQLGIDEIRADDLSATELAAGAASRALADAGLSPHELDALIVIDARSPETLMSSEATRLQALLGARRALTFSVGGLGCASIGPALLAARGLLAADDTLDNVLIAHGSKPATPRRYRHPVTVSGDGGQAVLVSRRGPLRLLDVAQRTNGDYWNLFTVDYRDRPSADWREECADVRGYSFKLAIETRNHLRELHRALLDRNGMRPADIGCHLSQNLSLGSFRFTEETLGVELAGECAGNLRRYGHLGPGDVLLNLMSAIESGALAEGERAVLLNVSPVAAWSLLLVEHGDGGGTSHYL
ncbi:3-oxoacyl-[acyl-carrier-protein] synthase III C-terminal domain-containing protein [Streptomyces sp. NPDC097640]|uniref:3-oxoacyl-[acyl-carrier-protein] synthase III C-terminal domain-containing protein n=1 Tax=Streptomyces sp. NPDC097640 TaxID=3157229 RepID=UPI003323B631